MNPSVNEANFVLFAAQHYDSLFPDTIEFYEDLKRIVYIKRLFNMYLDKGELKERLIINHLVVLYNVFGENASHMLFLKLKDHHSLLKTFLTYMGRMPVSIKSIGIPPIDVNSSQIQMDDTVWRILKNL